MIRYGEQVGDLVPEQLEGFFVGWPKPPSPQVLHRVLSGSSLCILARDDDRVVGFVTVLSDGVLSAYIPLLEVLPSHQGRGIGTQLVRRVQELVGDLYMLDVMCDDDVVPFYERLGLRRATGMVRRNRSSPAFS